MTYLVTCTCIFFNRVLLNELDFIKCIVRHLVKKLKAIGKDEKSAIKLIESLSVLCSFNRIPLQQNQGKKLYNTNKQ